MRVILWVAILFFSSCATTTNPDMAIRTGLDVMAEVIGPSSKLAADGCMSAQYATLNAAKAAVVTPEKAGEQLATIRAHCVKVRAVFDALRTKHEIARTYVNEGKLAEAQQTLDDLKLLFRSLGSIP